MEQLLIDGTWRKNDGIQGQVSRSINYFLEGIPSLRRFALSKDKILQIPEIKNLSSSIYLSPNKKRLKFENIDDVSLLFFPALFCSNQLLFHHLVFSFYPLMGCDDFLARRFFSSFFSDWWRNRNKTER